MRKINKIILVNCFLVALCSSLTLANPTVIIRDTIDASLNSGEYMFTHEGNDGELLDIAGHMEDWFEANYPSRNIDLSEYAKVEEPATSSGGLTIVYDDGNLKGSWTTIIPIEFYIVKSSIEFAAYWIDGGATSGVWSTQHLLTSSGNIPEMSHLSALNPIVPAPSAFLLGGVGVSIVGWIKKRKSL